MSAAKFREYAAEHLDWAKTAKSPKERQTFQQMAEAGWRLLRYGTSRAQQKTARALQPGEP